MLTPQFPSMSIACRRAFFVVGCVERGDGSSGQPAQGSERTPNQPVVGSRQHAGIDRSEVVSQLAELGRNRLPSSVFDL